MAAAEATTAAVGEGLEGLGAQRPSSSPLPLQLSQPLALSITVPAPSAAHGGGTAPPSSSSSLGRLSPGLRALLRTGIMPALGDAPLDWAALHVFDNDECDGGGERGTG